MIKLLKIFIFLLAIPYHGDCQVIPFGLSKDSIVIPELFSSNDMQSFYLYKPATYTINSPIWFVMHGTGGTGAGSINNLSSIADRQSALIVALTLDGPGALMISQTSLIHKLDSADFCVYRAAGSLVMDKVYDYVSQRESRVNIPCYLSGFSAGAQFVSRYILIRQAYPDHIPLKMSLSMSPIGYTLPTDTFLGVPQPWVCGTLLNLQPPPGTCYNAYNVYNWNCNEHIIQFYNENFAVCVGNQDLASQINGGCYDITGVSRVDRARTFHAFCDSNAITRGTSLQWQYAEIPGAGHSETDCFLTKALPTDSFTIAENLLFNTPYHSINHIAPIAEFSVDTTVIPANDTVYFQNQSQNAVSYFWDFGDSTYSNLVNPYHIYTQPGLYEIELTATNSAGCDNWKQRRHYILVTSGVGFQELNSNNLKVYPNPSRGNLEIKGLDANFIKYAIYNFEGQLIKTEILKEKFEANIDISYQPSGVYLISLIHESGKSIGIKHIKL